MPQEFSLPGPSVTSLRNLIPIVTLLTKHLCSLPGLPIVPINMVTRGFPPFPLSCVPWQMITKFFSSIVLSKLTVCTLNHYASNLLKGVPREFSLPGLPSVTSLRNLIPIVTLLTKAICRLHWLPCIPWQIITMVFSSTVSNDSCDKGGRPSSDSLLTVRTLYY